MFVDYDAINGFFKKIEWSGLQSEKKTLLKNLFFTFLAHFAIKKRHNYFDSKTSNKQENYNFYTLPPPNFFFKNLQLVNVFTTCFHKCQRLFSGTL